MTLAVDHPIVELSILLFGERAREAALDLGDVEALRTRLPTQFSDRGLGPREGISATVALTLVGDSVDKIAEVDWKASIDDIKSALDSILPTPAPASRWASLAAQLEKAGYDEESDDTDDAFDTVNAQLAPEGMVSAWLQIDSDSYPFVVIPSRHVARVRELVETLSIELEFPAD